MDDVSASSNSAEPTTKTVDAVARKDARSIPKLCGDKDLKPNTVTKKPPGETKIPMFRRSQTGSHLTSNIPPKRNYTPNAPRSNSISTRAPLQSQSKLGLTFKEFISKNIESNASRLNVKKINSMSTQRCETARRTLTTRRSASIISYGSVRPQKDGNDFVPLTVLGKIGSSSGDHVGRMMNARERVAENNKLRVFESLQKKLQDMQSEFMQKFETLKITSPDKVKAEYKFVSMIRNDECKLVVNNDDLLRMPKKLPIESVRDFKEKVKNAMDYDLMKLMENLQQAYVASTDTERTLTLEETRKNLEYVQAQKLQELYNSLNELCARDNTQDTQIVRMQQEIQESKIHLQTAERTIADLLKERSTGIELMEIELKDKFGEEVTKREAQIAELNKKLKAMEKQLKQTAEEMTSGMDEKSKLQYELMACKESIHSLNKNIKHLDQQLFHEKKEKHDKIEMIKKLEVELEAAKHKIDEMRENNESDPNQQHREVTQLKSRLELCQKEKEMLLPIMEKLHMEHKSNSEWCQRLHDAEKRIHELEATIEEQTRKQAEGTTHDVISELTQLRQSDLELRHEIEKMEIELQKAQHNVCHLEEQVERDQQLLEVRSELITSLQTNDNSRSVQLEAILSSVGEKSNIINEVGLSNEMRTKSDEFSTLFTTLSTKQMELSRQEHMIKLLEESNERSQMLRVRQEEKIARMEEEIALLKQTIHTNQKNAPGTTACKNVHIAPVGVGDTDHSESDERLYYFSSERHRKRKVDINVRKYQI